MYKQILIFASLFVNVYSSDFNPCAEQYEIITDFSPDDCEQGTFYVKDGNDAFNCFPRCFEDFASGTLCDPNPCPPGYKCPESSFPYCELDEDSCFKYHAKPTNTPNPYLNAWWKPECLLDGTWAPKQCKGDKSNGRCFCYDSAGNRIFGQAFTENAANMTCACSRRKAESLKNGNQFYSTLHCDSMGNYEPLQCDEGKCWCVETQTGETIGKVVPEKMMIYLSCYSKENITEQYMRQCESNEYAQKKILHELSTHGTYHVNFPHILCDADGTYGHYQISDGIAYCKWKDNSIIASYTSSVEQNLDQLNCNCARDVKIYEGVGLKQNLLCLGNGNYKPQQQLSNGDWYCVDKDGFRKSPYLQSTPSDDACAAYI